MVFGYTHWGIIVGVCKVLLGREDRFGVNRREVGERGRAAEAYSMGSAVTCHSHFTWAASSLAFDHIYI